MLPFSLSTLIYLLYPLTSRPLWTAPVGSFASTPLIPLEQWDQGAKIGFWEKRLDIHSPSLLSEEDTVC